MGGSSDLDEAILTALLNSKFGRSFILSEFHSAKIMKNSNTPGKRFSLPIVLEILSIFNIHLIIHGPIKYYIGEKMSRTKILRG